jgi:hypothetical protein
MGVESSRKPEREITLDLGIDNITMHLTEKGWEGVD